MAELCWKGKSVRPCLGFLVSQLTPGTACKQLSSRLWSGAHQALIAQVLTALKRRSLVLLRLGYL